MSESGRRRRWAWILGAFLLFGTGVALGGTWPSGSPGPSGLAEVGPGTEPGRPAGAVPGRPSGPRGADARGPVAGSTREPGERAAPIGGAPTGREARSEAVESRWPQASPRAGGGAPESRRTYVVEVAERVTPSVVSVRVVQRVTARGRNLFDPFDFFRTPRTRRVRGIGSGFAIDDAGHVLTNAHVVRRADRIQLASSDGRLFTAELVGVDEMTDLALLKVPPGRIPPVPLGSSSDLMVGEPTIAVGNPYGFALANTEATVTSGVVSGVGRDIRSAEERGVLYADMIQTDAAINPGNSGGPLVNANGEVIGVNSSILSESGGSEGMGFAIPVDRALRIAEELRRFGRVRQPWAGADVAAEPGDSVLSRTVVRRVAPDSPAEAAGLREGDVLLSVGDNRIDGPLDWEMALLDAGVGRQVAVRYLRGGRERTGRLRVEEPPSERAERVEVLRGLQLVTVTPQIAVERDLGVERGALIVDISDEAARATRMRAGDVILGVDRREVGNAEDAAALFRSAADRGFIQVFLYRDGSTVLTSFRVG